MDRNMLLKRWSPLLILLLSLAAGNLYAATDTNSIMQVNPQDKTIEYMRIIFGDIVNVITGGTGPSSEDSMVGALSEVLNVGMLYFTGLIIGFVYINSILNSAQDGEPLGKNYDTYWVPLRMIVAMGLILPYQGGYSSMQTAVLWIAGNGVGMANTTWNKALEHMKDTGSSSPTHVTFDFDTVAQNLLNSQFCLEGINMADRTINIDDKIFTGLTPTAADVVSDGSLIDMSNPDNRGTSSYTILVFDSAETQESAAEKIKSAIGVPRYYGQAPCGKIGFSFFDVDRAIDYKADMDAFHQSIVNALGTLNTQMNTIAKKIAQNAAKKEGDRDPRPVDPEEYNNAVKEFKSSYMTASITLASAIATKRINWWANGNPQTTTQTIGSKDAGWITAGAWYWDIQRINRTTRDILSARPFYQPPSTKTTSNDEYQKTYLPAFKAYLDGKPPFAEFSSPINQQANSSYTATDFGSSSEAGLIPAFKKLTLSTITGTLQYALQQTLNQNDPITAMAGVGDVMLNILESMYTAKVLVQAALAAGNSTAIGIVTNLTTGLPAALQSAFNSFVELFYGCLITMGPLVLFLTFYLPAIPMVLWVMGVAGYFVLLLEAVIAAPLWAASHAMPEGRGFVGQRAVAGYMVLLSLFIRPTLMLIGFLCSMTLMIVLGKLIQLIAIPALTSQSGADGFSGIATLLAGIAILTLLLVQTAHRAYDLQSELPDKILRFIGGGGEQLGESSHERQGRSIFIAGASQGANKLGGGIDAASIAKKREADAATRAKLKEQKEARNPGTPSPNESANLT